MKHPSITLIYSALSRLLVLLNTVTLQSEVEKTSSSVRLRASGKDGIISKKWRLMLILGISLSGFCWSLNANNDSKGVDLEQLRSSLVRRIGPNTAIEEKEIFAIHQDRFGFIWVATIFKLYRFDGVEFVDFSSKFNRDEKTQHRLVYTIAEEENALWFACHEGLYRYDYLTDKVSFMKGSDNSREVKIAPTGRVWMLDSQGRVHTYQYTEGELVEIKNDALTQLNTAGVFYQLINFDKNGFAWLIGRNGEISQIRCDEHDFFVVGESSNPLSGSRKFTTTCSLVRDNCLWIGTSPNGLFRIDLKTGSVDQFHSKNCKKPFFRPGNRLAWLKMDENGRLWSGAYDGGLSVYLPEKERFERISYTKGNVSNEGRTGPRCGLIDRDNNVWIGSMDLGLFVVNTTPELFSYEPLIAPRWQDLGDNYINFSMVTSDGTHWLSIRGNGLCKKEVGGEFQFNIDFVTEDDHSSIINFTCIAEDSLGRIWFGTTNHAISIYEPKEKTFKMLPGNQFKDRSIATLLSIGNEMWVASDDTLVRIDINRLETNGVIEGLDSRVRSLNMAPNGLVWIGCQKGLYIYDIKKGEFVTKTNPPEPNSNKVLPHGISDVIFMEDGTTWTASYGTGLTLLDSNYQIIQQFLAKDGLVSEAIGSIQIDANGILWGATRSGILSLDTNDFTTKFYSTEDGLQGKRFEISQSYTRKDGHLIFPSKNGLLRINPNHHQTKSQPLTPQFTAIEVLGKPLLVGGLGSNLEKHIVLANSIKLEHSQSVFRLAFSAMNYKKMGKTWFRHRLIGLEDEWSEPSLDRSVSFSLSSSRKYEFELMASSDPDEWNGPIRSLSIDYQPSVWTRWWMILVYMLLALLLLFFVSAIHTRNLRKHRKKLEKMVDQRTTTIEERNKEILTKNRELEKHRHQLEQMVEERTQKLSIAKERAEKADHLKSAFLANMSHEIRTPLNAIVGFSQILTETKTLDQEQKNEYSKIIQNSADGLTHLIDDILDLSKLESDQISIKPETFDLLSLCKELHTEYQPRISKQKPFVKLGLQLENAEQLIVDIDPHRTRQILINFIDNAIKFTRSGLITIAASKDEMEAIISVKDTGSGIPIEDQQNIFERFRKLDGQGKEIFRGAGLGLAISNKLAKLIGGKITLKSELGKGSTFSLHLPLINKPVSQKAEASMLETNEYDWSGKHLLIAEDETNNFRLIEEIVRSTGITVHRAENGLQAINKVEKSGLIYDVILMDIQMPQMDGFEALKHIRKNHRHLPIIAHSAHTLLYDRDTMISKGFSDFISKPIHMKKALALIDSLLKKVDHSK